MKAVHFTKEHKWVLRPINITNPYNRGGLLIKPIGGLWCSPINSEYGWKDWCIAEEWGDLNSQAQIILDLDTSNFITIDSTNDVLEKLIWVKIKEYFWEIDFETMKANGIDGIYLTEKGQDDTSFMIPYHKSLYGWDCESLVILNERCINNWEVVNNFCDVGIHQRGK